MAHYGIWWETTPNWTAACPKCETRYTQNEVPCPNCHKDELQYFREVHYAQGASGQEEFSTVSLRCLYEGVNFHGFMCTKCLAAVPMGCMNAFLTKRFHPARPLFGLLGGACAALPLLLASELFASQKAKENACLAALVVAIAAYLHVSRYVRLYYGKEWRRISNE